MDQHKGIIANALGVVSGAEGWAVFEAEGSILNDGGKRPFQLQRDDEAAVFESDKDAASHVVRCAGAGSKPHMLALRYLRRFSRPEWIEVMFGAPVLSA